MGLRFGDPSDSQDVFSTPIFFLKRSLEAQGNMINDHKVRESIYKMLRMISEDFRGVKNIT